MKNATLVWSEEEDLLTDAILAFHTLSEAAERLATWKAGEKVGALVPEGLSRLAEKAAVFAAKHPPRSFLRFPDPLARLAGTVERLRELIPPALENKFAGDVSAYRKVRAGELAAKCRELAIIAGMRFESLLEKRQSAAKTEARIADAEAEMYKAQGKAEAEAGARKRAEEKREEAEAARREAEIALARLEEHKRKGRGVRGKTIPTDVKKAVLDWMDKEYPGGVKGEGWQAAFDSLAMSEVYTTRIQRYIGSAAALARIVEAARLDAKRQSNKTRRQKK